MDEIAGIAGKNEPSAWQKTIVAAMTSYIDSGSIVAGAAGLSLWKGFLQMDGLQLGLLAALSSNAASAAVGALIGGKVCDKYGRKFVYTYDLLIYILGMLLIVFAQNFGMLLTGYIVVGLGIGADVVASWTLIAEEASAKNRAKHCGTAQLAWTLGPAVVLLLSAWLNQYGVLGSRIVFGHLILIAAWVWYQRLKMPESMAWKRTKAKEERLIRAGAYERVSYRAILRGINLKTVLFLCGVYTVWNLCAGTWGFFMPYIFERFGNLSNTLSQLMNAASFVVSLFSTFFLFMQFGDRVSRRLIYGIVGGLYVAAWTLWMLPGEMLSLWMLALFVVFAGVNNDAGQQAFYQLWCTELFPTKYRATAMGLTFFITRIVAAVWSFCLPLIVGDFGFRYAIMLLAGFAFISWVIGTVGAPDTEGRTLKEIEIERYGHEVK